MSISTFLGINTALRGLQAAQEALDVTAHNISNASTQGYTRQVTQFTSVVPLQASSLFDNAATGMLPQGVDIQSISRVRDGFADVQYRAQNQSLGSFTAQADALGQAQDSLDEPSDSGLNAVLSKFWDSWDALSNHPEDQGTRQALINQAQLLTGRINELQSEFSGIQTNASQQVATITGSSGQIQTDANQIAQLNQAIKQAESIGAQPNDLLDRRDLALDDLSGLGQVSVTDLGNGSIQVNFGDASQPLVNDTTVNWPQTVTNPGGKLGALMQVASTTSGPITGYLGQLDTFAQQLISTVNTTMGGPFFSGTNAATIGVAATASTVRTTNVTPAPAGANDVAVAVAALRGGTADNAYANLVSQIGGDVSNMTQQQTNAQALVTAAGNRRQSTSGVSLDEEMTNMIAFQRGYQASAKVLNTLDSMLNTLINNTAGGV